MCVGQQKRERHSRGETVCDSQGSQSVSEDNGVLHNLSTMAKTDHSYKCEFCRSGRYLNVFS